MAKKTTIGGYFKSLDLFSTNFTFKTNGNDSFQTGFGACMSLMIMLIVALYGINKFFIMRNYDDTSFNEYIVTNGLTNDAIG